MPIEIIIYVLISFFITGLCIIIKKIYNHRHKSKKEKCFEYLSNNKDLINKIDKIFDNNDFDVELYYSYFTFKISCAHYIEKEIFNEYKMNKNFIPLKEYANYIDDDILSKAINHIIDSAVYSDKIIGLWGEQIKNSIKSAEEEENKAIEYNNSFGKESEEDPALHPFKTTDIDILETVNEKSINDLYAFNTVEDLNNE